MYMSSSLFVSLLPLCCRWICWYLFQVWCIPTMVPHNINTSSVLWEDAGDVLPHWWPWLPKGRKAPSARESRNQDEPVDLHELMRFSLTPVAPSLGTADGSFNKNNKGALLHFFTDDNQEDISYPKCALQIQDGNAFDWFLPCWFYKGSGTVTLRIFSVLSDTRASNKKTK